MNIQRFVCNPLQENCYVVSDSTNEGIIIDCGAYFPAERKAIVEYIRKEGLEIKHLLATHGHFDHNMGNNTLLDEFELKVEIHPADEYLITDLDGQCHSFMGVALGFDAPPVGHFFSEGEAIVFGNHQLEIIPTPGHTPGGVVFHCPEENVAFSGDTLFSMSIGRTDFEGGSFEAMMMSLHRLPHFLSPDTIILPGHGPKTTLATELKLNPYLS